MNQKKGYFFSLHLGFYELNLCVKLSASKQNRRVTRHSYGEGAVTAITDSIQHPIDCVYLVLWWMYRDS